MNGNGFPATRAARKLSGGQRLEGVVLVVILLTVGGFAGAASFTHVHDWTMNNSPTGTGDWFGWANAVVSELVPIAAMLVMRRRRRDGQSIVYPAALLVAALALSVTAQLAVAKPGFFGGLVSVVPALAFAALAKLVLGKAPKPETIEPEADPVQMAEPVAVQQIPSVAAEPMTVTVSADPEPVPVSMPEPVTPQPVPAVNGHRDTSGLVGMVTR